MGLISCWELAINNYAIWTKSKMALMLRILICLMKLYTNNKKLNGIILTTIICYFSVNAVQD